MFQVLKSEVTDVALEHNPFVHWEQTSNIIEWLLAIDSLGIVTATRFIFCSSLVFFLFFFSFVSHSVPNTLGTITEENHRLPCLSLCHKVSENITEQRVKNGLTSNFSSAFPVTMFFFFWTIRHTLHTT
jgi:hypothetical protein